MEKVNCTYCEKEIETNWYHVCSDCMDNIVKPCHKNRSKSIKFNEYKNKVWKLTEDVSHKIAGIETRGWNKNHIDHKYSIWQGFKDGKTVEEIADISNLRMLDYKENMKKGIRCEL